MRGCFAFVCLLASFVLASPAVEAASVREIRSEDELIPGPASMGQVGDLLLENGWMRAIVSHVDHPAGRALSGGHLLDVAMHGGEDEWGQSLLALTDEFPRQVRYETMEIAGTGTRASVRFVGKDSRNDNIEITTTYSLADGSNYLEITTEYRNGMRGMVDSVIAGDRIALGTTWAFVPGYGRLRAGLPEDDEFLATPSRILLVGDGVTYGWESPYAGSIRSQDENAIRVTFTPFRVGGKETETFVRRLFVGGPDPGALLTTMSPDHSIPVPGRIYHEDFDDLLHDTWVEIRRDGIPYSLIRPEPDGRFLARLPAGVYDARAMTTNGTVGPYRHFNPAFEQTGELRLQMDDEAKVTIEVRDERGDLMPAKVSHVREGAEDLSVPHKAQHYLVGGTGFLRLPAGTNRLYFSHGPLYDRVVREIDFGRSERVEIAVTLAKQVDAGGLHAVDGNVRSTRSLISKIAIDDLRDAALVEDLDALILLDRGTNGSTQLPNETPLILEGQEVLVPRMGSFGLYPISPEEHVVSIGSQGMEGKAPTEFLRRFRRVRSKPLVQVQLPRNFENGYFHAIGLDPRTGLSTNIEASYEFDLIEVANASDLRSAPAVLNDWFHLLNLGHRVFATGNSDARNLGPGALGYPRNYVNTNGLELTESSLIDALRNGRSIVTTGPLLDVTVNGRAKPGETIVVRDGLVDVAIEVQAAEWIDLDKMRVFANAQQIGEQTIWRRPGETSVRLKESLPIHRDTWVVVVVTGKQALAPVANGPRGEPIRPVAFSNPIWIDENGNGRFDEPGVR